MVDKLHQGSQQLFSAEEVVDAAPIGSRVMFRNSHPSAVAPFINENTLKIGHRK